jgi:hypothetical protein
MYSGNECTTFEPKIGDYVRVVAVGCGCKSRGPLCELHKWIGITAKVTEIVKPISKSNVHKFLLKEIPHEWFEDEIEIERTT